MRRNTLYNISDLKNNIRFLENAENIKEISGGFSKSKKYKFEKKENSYIIKLSEDDENDFILTLFDEAVPVPKVIEKGKVTLYNISKYYTITSYLEGASLDEKISDYSKGVQYNIGYNAGKILKSIHNSNFFQEKRNWTEKFTEKYNKYRVKYDSINIDFDNITEIIDYIDDNITIISNDRVRMMHDDYHLDNIITKNGEITGIIDFDNSEWGDPYHDFVKMFIYSREYSVAFCKGQLNGYFGNNISSEFWKTIKIYIAMAIISSLVWCQEHTPNRLQIMKNRLNTVVKDFNAFNNKEPEWFIEY